MLKNKSVIIAGGEGLIGQAIVGVCREAGAEVKSLDFKDGADIQQSATRVPLWLPDKLDIYVCSVYPEYHEHHMEAYLAAEVVARRMFENGGGSIVLLSSIYGMIGADYSCYKDTDMDMPISYSFVKGGIISMTRALATKYAPVRVNCVSPGGVFDNQDPKFVSRYCKRVPLGRMATPEDIAGPVVFLASDAAKYITGINMAVDGGLTAW